MKMKNRLIPAAVCLLVSCQEKQAPAAEHAPAAPSGEAKAIRAARATVRPGEEITLAGRIMGNAKPFVEGRAVFILGDPDVLTPCNERPGDNCETPWDVCCDTAEDKKAGTATIQIAGADGKILRESPEGVGGLEKLAGVTVTGKVAEGSSADLLVVNTRAIRVERGAD